MHSARAINPFHVGVDDRTAYQRWKGKPFKREIAEFGESVLYLKAGSAGHDKLVSRWESGVWLGVRDETSEVIIGTSNGVIKARDFKRLGSNSDRWSVDNLRGIAGTPWEPVPGKSDDTIPVRIRMPEEGGIPEPVAEGTPRPEIRRRARITRDDVVRIGFSLKLPRLSCDQLQCPSRKSHRTMPRQDRK